MRSNYPDHRVTLFRKDGVAVDSFMFPPTDPRFVKHDDIAKLAAEKSEGRVGPEWDYLSVTFYSMDVKADAEGNLISWR